MFDIDLRPALLQICAYIEIGLFHLVEIIYGLFFAVSRIELFTGTVVVNFFNRLQLIIGVFILFQSVVIILKGIVNPDNFMNSKTGAKNLVIRILTSLIILTLIVPFDINAGSDKYMEKVKEHGLLFGTLYSLQNRILQNNTIGALIFGTEGSNSDNSLIPNAEYNETLNEDSGANLINTNVIEEAKNSFQKTFSMGFFRAFFRLKEENPCGKNQVEYKSREKMSFEDLKKKYNEDVKTPEELAELVVYKCKSVKENEKNEKVLLFDHTYIIPFFLLIFLMFIFLSFSFDVVVRAAKLAILRIVAPIPIISYMNPNGSDSPFNAWTKLLISTYIDLFIRLATVYFVMFIIGEIFANGASANDNLGFISTIVVVIGLLIFAKQAPKFAREAIGLKGDTGSLFGGLKDALTIGAGIGGVAATGATGLALGITKHKSPLGKIFGGVTGLGKGIVSGGIHAADNYLKNDKPASWKDVSSTWGDMQKFRNDHAVKEMKAKTIGETLSDAKETIKDTITNPEKRKENIQKAVNKVAGFDSRALQNKIMGQEASELINHYNSMMGSIESDTTAVDISSDFKKQLKFDDPIEKAEGKQYTKDGHLIDFNIPKSPKTWTSIRKSLEASGSLDDDPLLQNVKACEDYSKRKEYERIISTPYDDLDAAGKNIVYNATKIRDNIRKNSDNPGYAKINEKWIANPTFSEIDYSAGGNATLTTLNGAAAKAKISASGRAKVVASTKFAESSPEVQSKVQAYYDNIDSFVAKNENLNTLLSLDTSGINITDTDIRNIGIADTDKSHKITFNGTDIIDLSKETSLNTIYKGIQYLESVGATESDSAYVQMKKLFEIKSSEKIGNVSREIEMHSNQKLAINSSDYSTIALDRTEFDQNAIMYGGTKYIDFNQEYTINDFDNIMSRLENIKSEKKDASEQSAIDDTIKKIQGLRDTKAKQLEATIASTKDPIYKALHDELNFSRGHIEIEELRPVTKSITVAREDTSSPHSDGIDKLCKTVQFKELLGVGTLKALGETYDLGSTSKSSGKKDNKGG